MARANVTEFMNPYMVRISGDDGAVVRLIGMIGSAPDIAGQEKVNPVAAILSTAMMLQYSFNLPEEAKAIEEAVRRTIDDGISTGDLGGKSTTKQVGDHVAQVLSKILSG